MTVKQLGELFVDITKLREKIAEGKRTNVSYLLIDDWQRQLDAKCDRLARVVKVVD